MCPSSVCDRLVAVAELFEKAMITASTIVMPKGAAACAGPVGPAPPLSAFGAQGVLWSRGATRTLLTRFAISRLSRRAKLSVQEQRRYPSIELSGNSLATAIACRTCAVPESAPFGAGVTSESAGRPWCASAN